MNGVFRNKCLKNCHQNKRALHYVQQIIFFFSTKRITEKFEFANNITHNTKALMSSLFRFKSIEQKLRCTQINNKLY